MLVIKDSPREFSLEAFKQIIKYVKETLDFDLHHSLKTNENITGFSDAYWVGCLDDRRSTSVDVSFFFGNNMVLWYSKNQILYHCRLLKMNT